MKNIRAILLWLEVAWTWSKVLCITCAVPWLKDKLFGMLERPSCLSPGRWTKSPKNKPSCRNSLNWFTEIACMQNNLFRWEVICSSGCETLGWWDRHEEVGRGCSKHRDAGSLVGSFKTGSCWVWDKKVDNHDDYSGWPCFGRYTHRRTSDSWAHQTNMCRAVTLLPSTKSNTTHPSFRCQLGLSLRMVFWTLLSYLWSIMSVLYDVFGLVFSCGSLDNGDICL